MSEAFPSLPAACHRLLELLDTPDGSSVPLSQVVKEIPTAGDVMQLCEYHELIVPGVRRVTGEPIENGVPCLWISPRGIALLAEYRLRSADAKRTGGKEPQSAEPVHSPDFRCVNWFGAEYTFTPNQAAVVKVLWGNLKQGTPDVSDQYLLEAADCNSDRLYLVFRNHAAWGTMIVAGKAKGTRRLAEPNL